MMKPNVVRRLEKTFDLDRLRQEVERLTSMTPFHPYDNQIGLTSRPKAINPFYDGSGSLYDANLGAMTKESDFSEFHPDLRDWYLYQVYQDIQETSGGGLGRMRLMRLNPKGCLSMHRDSGVRLHIPILTNAQCFLVFQEWGAWHLPCDGHLYWVDTKQPHTAMNGCADDERIHLVFSGEGDWFPVTGHL